jgi:hypothetical protein
MSPTVLTQNGYQVKIYPNDHSPPHVHVVKAGNAAKVTLDPVEVKTNHGFNPRELGDIKKLVEEYQEELREEWDRLHPSP